MKHTVVMLAVVLALAAGAAGELCSKCKGKAYTEDTVQCSRCKTGWTGSGAFKLCKACSAKLGQCEHCRAPLKAAPKPEKVKSVVLSAARICRWVRWPREKAPATQPSQDVYLRTIQPVIEMGPSALPVLQELAKSPELSRFQRRIAEILAARVEHPEPFRKVDKMLHNPFRIRPPSVVPHTHAGFPSIPYSTDYGSEDMVHPDARKIVIRYGKALAEIRSLHQKYSVVKDLKPDSNRPLTSEEMRQYSNETAAIRAKYKIPWEDWVKFTGPKAVAPEYLLAWEEAAIRPLPRSWKMQFIMGLTETADEASVPILGELCRQMTTFSMPFSERRTVARRIARAFGRMPCKATLLEMSEILQVEQKLERKYWREFTSIVGIVLAESEKWNELLTKLASEKEMAEHVRRVRALMEPYVEYLKQKAASATTRPANTQAK